MSEVDAALDLIRDFAESFEGLKPSTLRAYLAGTKVAIKAVQADLPECGSHAEILTLGKTADKRGTNCSLFTLSLRWQPGGKDSVPAEDVRGAPRLGD